MKRTFAICCRNDEGQFVLRVEASTIARALVEAQDLIASDEEIFGVIDEAYVECLVDELR